MTKASPPVDLKLRGPTGLVAAVPAFIGFHPHESLVVVCITAAGLIGPIARVDLERADQPSSRAIAEQLTGYAMRYAALVALVCYTERPDRPALLEATVAALDSAKMPILDVLSVRDGLIRHARTAAAEAADHGTPEPQDDDPQVAALALVNVEGGRALLPDREALRASIAPPAGNALSDARAAVVGACEELTRLPLDATPIDDLLTDRAGVAMTRAHQQLLDAGQVGAHTAAELIVLVANVATRDAVIARAVAEQDPTWVATFISVATRCPPEESAEICSVLAVVAYRYGDGALSQVAIDRCLAAEPEHRLAHLMLACMTSGISPTELADLAGPLPADHPAPPRRRGGRRRRAAE